MCWIRKSRIEIANPMKRSYTPVLAVGIGAVAGLRTLAAPAVLAWAVKRRWIRLGKSPFATIISAKASKRITDLAVSELIADKLPFTPSRLKAGPLASRIVSGAVCGATIYGVVKKPLAEGAVLGGVGAIAGAFSGYHMRKRLSRDMPSLGVAVLEDALAIGGAVLITALAAQTSD
jgi:uncharacterized membrane protein